MAKTSGVILPFFYDTQKDLEDDLKRRDKEAGYTPVNPEEFMHSSTDNQIKNFIEHYGKRGMRWGVRKAPRQSSSDFKKTAPLRNRKTRELSNKQLQSVNARINMEQQYRRLNPSTVKIGANVAKGILATATTLASVYTLANSPAGKAGIAAVKKMLGTKS